MTATIAQEVTDWFAMDTPPIREGWYDVERRWADGSVYDIKRYWWNGMKFAISNANHIPAPIIFYQDVWRGLTEPTC